MSLLENYLIKSGTKINPNVRKCIVKDGKIDEFSLLAKKYFSCSFDNLSTLQLTEIFYRELGREVTCCKTCGKSTRFRSFNTGFNAFCGARCQMKHPDYKLTVSSEARIRAAKKRKENPRTLPNLVAGIKKAWEENKEQIVAKMLQSRSKNQSQYWLKRFHLKVSILKEQNFEILESQKNGKPKTIKHSCGQIQPYGRWQNQNTYLCSACHPNPRIQAESAFLDELENYLDVKFERNVKIGNYKVDGFFKNVAIEFNGLFWHSEAAKKAGFGGLSDNYHSNKCNFFNSHGIKLIQIFEDEWINKKEIVKNRIKCALNLSSRVFARKCALVTLSRADARNFLRLHHISGAVPCSKALGLTYQGELVAVATFGNYRFGKEDANELLRFATIGNVIGALSKLCKHFQKTSSKTLYSYSDNFWGNGSGYLAAGFKKIADVPAGYFYYDKKNFSRISRHAMRKSNFENVFGVAWDESLSETANAERVGCFRIYDAGKKKWILPINNHIENAQFSHT